MTAPQPPPPPNVYWVYLPVFSQYRCRNKARDGDQPESLHPQAYQHTPGRTYVYFHSYSAAIACANNCRSLIIDRDAFVTLDPPGSPYPPTPYTDPGATPSPTIPPTPTIPSSPTDKEQAMNIACVAAFTSTPNPDGRTTNEKTILPPTFRHYPSTLSTATIAKAVAAEITRANPDLDATTLFIQVSILSHNTF